MNSKAKKRGEGRFYTRNEIIWVEGSIEGVFYRKSTRKRANKLNLAWANEQRPLDVLSKIIDKESKREMIEELDFKRFGYKALQASEQNRAEETQKDYEKIFSKYILPYFKDFRLDQIKPMDIEAWQNPKKSSFKHLSYDRRKRIRGVLNMVLSAAHRNGLIRSDPAKAALNIVRNEDELEEKRIAIYSAGEISKIINLSTGWLKIYFMLSFTTGMRVGELLGLKWDDFDLHEGLLYLKRTRTNGKEKGSNRKKNHKRTIALFPDVVVALREFYNNRLDDNYLFVSQMNTPWSTTRHLIHNHIKPFFEANGIEYKKLKATRATFITTMIKSQVSITWLQSTVGHSKGSSITIKHYFDSEESIEEKKEQAALAAKRMAKKVAISYDSITH